ncbi:MAG: hypothetical protein J7M38_10890 [Armatimonadetes bacterium]|nr:hypothetical protein [Armatimonadota bacterium]
MKAGFSEQDVTPRVGVYLAGYPSRNEPSQGVDDPLYVRVMALEDDEGRRVVLVTGDLLKLPRDMTWRTKLWAETELGLPSASLIMTLSHTHAAPGLFIQRCYPHWPVNREYVCRFEQAVRDGIRAALDDLRPVRVRFGMHQAHFGVSRRLPLDDGSGKVKMGPNPDGYYDPELPVFAFDRDDEPAAVLYSYACHPTSKSALNVSADWPGQVATGLRRELGEEVIPIFAQGAGASIMPRMHQRDGEEEYAAYWAEVAADIAGFARSDAMEDITLDLRAAEREFFIPYDMTRFPSREELLALADPQDTPVPEQVRPGNRSILRLWARDMLEMQRTGELPEAFRMHVTRWQLADGLQLIGMSGEVTAEVGRMIKDLFPDRRTVFLGYCSYTDAYIPAAAMLPDEGHEALGSMYFQARPAPFVPEIDDIISREVAAVEV